MEKTKKCSGCKQDLSLTNFYKNKLISDGHSNYCVTCTKENSQRYFRRKKERLVKEENDNLMKMVLLSDVVNGNPENVDNLLRVITIEKMAKKILEEIDILKRNFSPVNKEDVLQNS
jgi:hypothetical protein